MRRKVRCLGPKVNVSLNFKNINVLIWELTKLETELNTVSEKQTGFSTLRVVRETVSRTNILTVTQMSRNTFSGQSFSQ